MADAPAGRGGIWLPSNDIVFAPDATGPLYRVSASGGTPTANTTLEKGEAGHRMSVAMPGGRRFLYAALPARNGKFEIYGASVNGGPRTDVGAFDATPVYADPGYLLYARQGVLAAQPLDATDAEGHRRSDSPGGRAGQHHGSDDVVHRWSVRVGIDDAGQLHSAAGHG